MTPEQPYRAETLPVVALAEGQRAAMCGDARNENPYDPCCTCYVAWNKGYDTQRERLRDEDTQRGDRH